MGWPMISLKYRCIFVHIPRTGGTSVEEVIWPGDRTEAELWMGFVEPMRNRYQTGGLQHLLAHQIRTEVGTETFNACFRFTIVRNPWDKAISQYTFMRRRPDLRALVGLAEDAPLEVYLERIALVQHIQWMPQVPFIQDQAGNQLVDFIARFETLEADMRLVFARIGIDCPHLPHRNGSPRENDYRHYFDASTRETVALMYAADIKRFKYTF
jgi:Sulfotransferase family